MSDPLLDAGPGPQGPSVDSCPYCGGLGYDWEVVANGVGGFPPEKVSCPACGGTGKKTSGEAGPALVGGGLDEARQGGEGPAGSSPNLPADLIDRAIWAADREYSSTSFTTAAPHSHRLCAAVKGVAPLLVEHGAERERVKWERQVGAIADSVTVIGRDFANTDAGGVLVTVAAALRSLLTGEGD